MSGFPLILAFVAAIVLMILAISKWKIHPFLSITVKLFLLASKKKRILPIYLSLFLFSEQTDRTFI